MKFSQWPLPTVRLVCDQCGIEQEMPRDGLIAIYGDLDMFSFRMDNVACKSDCKMHYPDAFLVDAILEPDPDQVLKKECIPEAKEWREKLGFHPRKGDDYLARSFA